MTMSAFYTNEDSHLSVNENFDDGDDDFEEMGDQPLNRPKVDFTPVRDPLVAALFGPACCSGVVVV